MATQQVSERRACRLLRLSRPVNRHAQKRYDDGAIIENLISLVERHPRFGFLNLFVMLRRAEKIWDHKHVWQMYFQKKLNLRRHFKCRYGPKAPEPLLQRIRRNQA